MFDEELGAVFEEEMTHFEWRLLFASIPKNICIRKCKWTTGDQWGGLNRCWCTWPSCGGRNLFRLTGKPLKLNSLKLMLSEYGGRLR
jgi:hypothetical protein